MQDVAQAALVKSNSTGTFDFREAVANAKTPEHLRELLAVAREFDADMARKAFNFAIADFQRRAPIVEKGDEANGKKYAALDRIWFRIRPLLTELGLSVTWQTSELRDGLCHLEGMLRHKDGHGEKLVFDVPLPAIIKNSTTGKDTQNAAQQMGSAHTYAKRYALCAALGLVTGDEGDDDGNKAGTTFVTFDQANELAEMIDACRGLAGFNEKAFQGWSGATVPSEIAANRYADVKAMLKKKLGASA